MTALPLVAFFREPLLHRTEVRRSAIQFQSRHRVASRTCRAPVDESLF